jgi:hypothetical protein
LKNKKRTEKEIAQNQAHEGPIVALAGT